MSVGIGGAQPAEPLMATVIPLPAPSWHWGQTQPVGRPRGQRSFPVELTMLSRPAVVPTAPTAGAPPSPWLKGNNIHSCRQSDGSANCTTRPPCPAALVRHAVQRNPVLDKTAIVNAPVTERDPVVADTLPARHRLSPPDGVWDWRVPAVPGDTDAATAQAARALAPCVLRCLAESSGTAAPLRSRICL